ncbi:MAG: Glucokinase [Phycisphaerales bacterium]|nr:Glucokinase [Phycisphaerales bacterium]
MSDGVSLGIDIGGTSVKAAVFHGSECVRTGQSPFYARPSTGELQAAIRAAVGPLTRVDRVGLCVPGLMNERRTRVEVSVNVPGLVGIDLDRLVPQALDLNTVHPTTVSNDAAATVHDIVRTHGLKGRTLVLTLGTGVGAAILDDQKPLDVEGGCPGHLGQIDVSVAGHDVIGPDGGAGGLEGYIGVPALRKAYGDDVAAAVANFNGHEPAVLALVRTIRIAHAFYRPHQIFLCGGIGIRLKHLLPTVERLVRTNLTAVARADAILICGDHDFHAARGAAWL